MEVSMTEQAPALTRHDIEAKIVRRTWENEAFRKELTADPAGVFVKYLEVPAKSLPKIVIHEEPAGSWYIVLPQKPANTDELSEPDLERVAGGELPLTPLPVYMAFSLLGTSIAAGETQKQGW
jgi:hypothetical protein